MSGEVPLPGPRSHVYVAKRAGGISGVSFIRALDPSHLPEDLLPNITTSAIWFQCLNLGEGIHIQSTTTCELKCGLLSWHKIQSVPLLCDVFFFNASSAVCTYASSPARQEAARRQDTVPGEDSRHSPETSVERTIVLNASKLAWGKSVSFLSFIFLVCKMGPPFLLQSV